MLAFVQEESARSRLTIENWLDQYLYIDIHEILFAEFPIVLHEWLLRLESRQSNFQIREAVKWSAQLICELGSVSNPISRAIYFWVDNILQGYITKFAVEMITS